MTMRGKLCGKPRLPGPRAGWLCAIVSASALACGSGDDSTRVTDGQSAVEPALGTPGSGVGAPEPGAIVFRSDRADAGIADLYVMSPQGSDIRRLTSAGN
jgi:hypothetical protein